MNRLTTILFFVILTAYCFIVHHITDMERLEKMQVKVDNTELIRVQNDEINRAESLTDSIRDDSVIARYKMQHMRNK